MDLFKRIKFIHKWRCNVFVKVFLTASVLWSWSWKCNNSYTKDHTRNIAPFFFFTLSMKKWKDYLFFENVFYLVLKHFVDSSSELSVCFSKCLTDIFSQLKVCLSLFFINLFYSMWIISCVELKHDSSLMKWPFCVRWVFFKPVLVSL